MAELFLQYNADDDGERFQTLGEDRISPTTDLKTLQEYTKILLDCWKRVDEKQYLLEWTSLHILRLLGNTQGFTFYFTF